MKPLRPIRNDEDHKTSLEELRRLWSVEPGTPEGDRFEILSILVDDYERRHFPIAPPDPVDAILFRLEQLGKTRADLGEILGSRSRASEVLNRKRNLSLAMIRRLHAELGIELSILVRSTADTDEASAPI